MSIKRSFVYWGKKKTRKEAGQLNNEDWIKTEKNLLLSPEVDKLSQIKDDDRNGAKVEWLVETERWK